MKIQELFRNQAKALRNCCGLVWSVPWQPLYLNTWSSISAAILEVCGIFRKWTSLEEVSHWRQAMRHGLTSDLLSAPWLQKQCDGHPMALQPSLSPPQRSVDPQSVNQEKAFLSPSSCLLPGHSSKKSSSHSSSLRASEERSSLANYGCHSHFSLGYWCFNRRSPKKARALARTMKKAVGWVREVTMNRHANKEHGWGCEKEAPLYTPGGHVDWGILYGNQFRDVSRHENKSHHMT